MCVCVCVCVCDSLSNAYDVVEERLLFQQQTSMFKQEPPSLLYCCIVVDRESADHRHDAKQNHRQIAVRVTGYCCAQKGR